MQGTLRGSPEGQRNPGRRDILQEQNLKVAGEGCHHQLKDEPASKKTGLAVIQEKKGEFMSFGRRGRQVRPSRMFVRLCRLKN